MLTPHNSHLRLGLISVAMAASACSYGATDGVITCPADVTLECPANTSPAAVGVATSSVERLVSDGTVHAFQKISQTSGGFNEILRNADAFGQNVANIGDLDGDGIADLAVGYQSDDDGGFNKGAIWILFLNADSTVKAKQKISDTAGGFDGAIDVLDSFGRGLARIGDIDGDGVEDLASGAVSDGDGGFQHGAVWILFMNTNGTVKAEAKISHTQGGFNGVLVDRQQFGASVAGLGDMNGDDVPDIAVGDFNNGEEGPGRGAVT